MDNWLVLQEYVLTLYDHDWQLMPEFAMADSRSEILQIRIESDLKEEVRSLAGDEDISVSDLCRKALRMYIQAKDGAINRQDAQESDSARRLKMLELLRDILGGPGDDMA